MKNIDKYINGDGVPRKTINEIYEHLQDELTKRIFENRLLYSFTEEQEYIDNIISLSCPKLNIKKEELKDFLAGFNNIVIYGAGFLGGTFGKLYDGDFVFCDASKAKQGGNISGHRVISPDELKGNDYKKSAVIVSVLGENDSKEITQRLLGWGFSESQIFTFQDMVDRFDFGIRFHAQYFNSDIIIPHFSENEIFVDAGSFNFATSSQFVQYSGNRYKKIIALEPNPEQYLICVEKAKVVENAIVCPYGLWNENTTLYFDRDRPPTSMRITEL